MPHSNFPRPEQAHRHDDAPAECLHIAEAHVVYDPRAAGYRAAAWCRCEKLMIRNPKLYDTMELAERAAKNIAPLAKAAAR